MLAGGVLGLIAQTLVTAGVALALPSTKYGFMVSAGDLSQVLLASTFAGAIGAVLGAGLGAILRNVGGAVTAVVFALFILPPLIVQLFSDAASWIPPALVAVISGVTTDVSVWAALAILRVGPGSGRRRAHGRPETRRRVRAACAEESQPLPTSRSCLGQPGFVSSVSSVRAIRSS